MNDNYEVPQDVQDRLNDVGEVADLSNTLLAIWADQARQALEDIKGLRESKRVSLGFAVQVSQQWGLTDKDEVWDYVRAYLDVSEAMWVIVLAAAEEKPEALKPSDEGADAVVNRDVYIDIMNSWFKLAWAQQTKDWSLDDGLPTAFGIQDALVGFIGPEGMIRQVGMLPEFDSENLELWQPGQED